MFKNKILFFTILALIISFIGCKSDKEEPIIGLVSGDGLFSTDTIADPGQLFRIRIKGTSGSQPATNFRILVETNGITRTALDSGIYSENFDFVKSFYFAGNDIEKWSFCIKNKDGFVASTSIIIKRNLNALYGPINEFPNITLKMQSNESGNMLILKLGTVISAASSANYQSDVDFLSYYSSVNFYTLSSPNETEAPGFYPSILSMTNKNEIRYKEGFTSITPNVYDSVMNDSIILASYDNSVVGKKKAKNVFPENVVSFAVQTGPMAGKKGLIKIIETNGESTGNIKLSIKIQR